MVRDVRNMEGYCNDAKQRERERLLHKDLELCDKLPIAR